MQTVLIVIHLMVTMAMIAVILLQRSEGGALGIGGSGSGLGGLFSARGAANTLTRTTTALAILFFTTSLALTLLSLGGSQSRSILDQAPESSGTAAPAETPTGPPTLPSANPPASEELPSVPQAR